MNFHPTTLKGQKTSLPYDLKYMRFELKNIEELLLVTMNSDAIFE